VPAIGWQRGCRQKALGSSKGGNPVDALIGHLRSLVGRLVQVERGGPEACQGWLQAVCADYLTLRSDDGADLYLPLHHIRSVTPANVPASAAAGPTGGQPDTFVGLLQQNQGRRVRLYHAGPEVSVGILQAAASDSLLLEVPTGELVCFTLFHIRSLYVPAEGEEIVLPQPLEPEPWQGR
jgi:spore coat protein B